ncbi:MAG: protein kinase, partial [Chloroflexota bacterium]
MKQYRKLVEILGDELGVEPAPETKTLFEQIRDGEIRTTVPEKDELIIRGYQLRELINEGNYAAVYRAYQPMTGRNVAVKVINPEIANQPDFIRRFEFEAQLVARLEHPYIVPLYDYWREPDCAFLVMRWLSGGNLQANLIQGAWQPIEAGKLLDQISAALATAHRQDVVHRDIKPANILLDEGKNAYLSDFGIARYLASTLDPDQPDFTASSPEYASPELLLGEPVTPLTDVYSLGIILYEILVGKHPLSGKWSDQGRVKRLPRHIPLASATYPGLPKKVDEVIQRATARNPADRYPDVLTLASAFREAIGVEASTIIPAADFSMSEVVNPYKGLRPFEETDAEYFYGREELVQQLLCQLSSPSPQPASSSCERFLAVVGASGCGKSSTIRAGLAPALRRGALPGSETWFVVHTHPGPHPLEEMEQALLKVAIEPGRSLIDDIRSDQRGLLRVVRRCLAGEKSKLVLIIDQFEELFTLVENERERTCFLDSLYTAVTAIDSPLYLIVVLRADFYDRPLGYPNFGQLVRDNLVTVLSLTPEQIIQAIVLPAERVGLHFESGLESQIVTAVTDQPGALPLMQYALTELFENREENRLTMAAYQLIGGVTGALGRRADELYEDLEPTGQETAQQLFLHLLKLGQEGEVTRRRVLRSELESLAINGGDWPTGSTQGPRERRLPTIMAEVIDLFGQHRLLTFDRDPVTRAPTVEVAHEALFQEWARLKNWLDNYRNDIRLKRRLESATAEWMAAGQEASFLLRGSHLNQTEAWANETKLALTPIEWRFLAASLAARRRRQAAELARAQHEEALIGRSRNILRLLVIILALATLVAAILARSARRAQVIAQEESQARATQQAVAESESDARATQQFLAEEQADLATSRELAASALNNLAVDPERSILLALYAFSRAYTLEAENALHQAVQSSRLQQTLWGHSGRAYFVTFSPDGSKLATSNGQGTVIIWDANTGDSLLTLRGHSDETFGVDFSPDGKQLAAASYDGTAIIWDVQSGQQLLTLAGHESELVAVQFSPDGHRLVTNGLYDSQVKVWDARTGEELNSFLAHQAPVWYVTYDPAGERLATASVDGTARVWDADTNRELLTLGGHDDVVSRVNFSPDGSRLATSSLKARIWDAATGQEQLTLDGHTSLILWVEFSPDGSRLATASVDGKVKVWDAVSGEELFTLAGHTGPVLGMDFSPDGSRLATGSFDGSVRIWDLAPERELLTITGHTDMVNSIAFNHDGTQLLSGSYDGTARVWDVGDPSAGTFGREMLAVGEADREEGVRSVAFSPDGSRFLAGNAEGIIKVYDAATGQALITLRGHAPGQSGETTFDGITGAAFSPDGSLIATASDDLTAKIWDASTGRELFSLEGHASALASNPPFEGVVQVAFHPFFPVVVTAGADGTVKAWSTEDGRQIFDQLAHPESVVIDLAFSPDGSRLATGAFDGTAKIWRILE